MMQTELDIQARLRALEEAAENRPDRQFDSLAYRDHSAGENPLKHWLRKLHTMWPGSPTGRRRQHLSPRASTE